MKRRRLVPLGVAVLAVIVGLHLTGRFIEGPTGFSGSAMSDWFADPVNAAAGILRLAALALSYYLLAVMVLLFVYGERVERSPLARLVPLGLLAALGLATASSVAAMQGSGGSLELQAVPDPLRLTPAEEPLVLSPTDEAAPDAPVQHPLAAPRETTTIDASVDASWTVALGESFWSIAEEHLGDVWGLDELSDEHIVSYWKPLIAANEDRLVDPDNPDLLLPGQELRLPPAPQAPAG